jgi:hypothetical protein
MSHHVAIDRDSMEVLGVGDYRALSVLSVVQERPNTSILPAQENRSYSCFTHAQLSALYLALAKVPFSGVYAELVQAVRALVLRIPPIAQTEEQLNAAADKKFGPEKFEQPAPRQKRPAAQKTPSVRKPIATDGIARPKSGSTTGKVWDICDELAKSVQDKKQLKMLALEVARKEGINDSTLSVQFGKWFAVVGSTFGSN